MKNTGISILLFLCALPAVTHGSKIGLIRFDSRRDITDGDMKAVRVSSSGEIRLGAPLRKIWESSHESMVLDIASAGKNHWVIGTANDGKVFGIDADGTSKLLFDSPEVAILSLTTGKDGTIYAGTAPSGLVYAIRPDKKTPARVFVRTGTHYVWDLHTDESGNIWAVTGDPAVIIRYAASGRETGRWEVRASHVRTSGIAGNVFWAGTADPAAIYRIDHDDLQLIYSGKEMEISDLICGSRGTVWFTAVSSASVKGAEIRPGMALSPYKADPKSAETNTLYRLDATGIIESWWETKVIPIFSLQLADDKPVVACGEKGFLFRLDGPGRATLLGSTDDRPIVSMMNDHGSLVCGTGGGAGVRIMGGRPVDSGFYQSAPYDCGMVSQFGKIRLSGRNIDGVTLVTRSGNNEDPDDLWSDWAPLHHEPGGLQITSPPARFIQWKATLSRSGDGPSPVIDDVVLAVSRPNRTPRIGQLVVYPVSKGIFQDQPGGGKIYRQRFADGTRFDYTIRGAGGNGLPKGKWFKLRGMRTARWAVTDPDKDRLTSEIAIRPATGQNWTILEKHCMNPVFSFDSTAFPDGEYILRVRVSDRPSNPRGSERESERVSRIFRIDNTPPTFGKCSVHSGESADTVVVSGTIRDNMSRIKHLEYSFDADRWIPFVSEDGILDSPVESFRVAIEPTNSPARLFLRATDAGENVATASVSL